jgi:hypothetical protein
MLLAIEFVFTGLLIAAVSVLVIYKLFKGQQ